MVQRGKAGLGVAQRGVVRPERTWEGDEEEEEEEEGEASVEVIGRGREKRVSREVTMDLRRMEEDMMVEVWSFAKE